MWMTAIAGLATTFIECTLAQVYKIQCADGVYRGGPAYYIERALGQRWMSAIFAIFLILAYGFVFSGAQANTIAKGMDGAIARTAEKIVPIMAIA